MHPCTAYTCTSTHVHVHNSILLLSPLLRLSLLSLFPFLSLMLVCFTHIFHVHVHAYVIHVTCTCTCTVHLCPPPSSLIPLQPLPPFPPPLSLPHHGSLENKAQAVRHTQHTGKRDTKWRTTGLQVHVSTVHVKTS